MRIVVDRELCLGAGQCVLAAPELFDQSEEDGRVELLVDQQTADQHQLAREAAYLCPSGAISLVDEGSEEPAGRPGGRR